MFFPLLILAIFGYYIYSQSKKGKLNTCSLAENVLYKRLYILPCVQLLLTLIWLFIEILSGEIIGSSSIALPILFLIVEIAVIVCTKLYLKKKAVPANYFMVSTGAVSLLLCVLLASSLYDYTVGMFGYADSSNYGLLSMMDGKAQSKMVIDAFENGFLLFAVLLVLEYFYVRWICFYFNLGSPVAYVKSLMNKQKSNNQVKDTTSKQKSKTDKLIELKKMLDAGVINQEEFNKQKQLLLDEE